MKRKLIYIFLAVLLTSCAVSRKVKYDDLSMDLSNIKSEKLSFALLDHREQVVDGSRKADFVGYMRSNVGIAYPIGTESKKGFIDDLAVNIITSLNRFDIKASLLKTSWVESEQEVKEKLFNLNNGKKILLTFDELHTDGYAIQVLHFKINVFVYDETNRLSKYKLFKGKRKLGGTAAWGAGPYKEYMPEAIVNLIEEIFKDEEILTAIN